ncbi:hypothetical protein KUTeg_019459 [Tegillarca granosa]|uniref:DUF4371 domain-containing protein n=1 Tax=Tegillarca granosa TaxID=220873 RepID=A0ABQ9ECK9_TEGGR|nr:hypothetical protein KUTeg_019459 [Tegillarca granosa]
MLRIDGDGFGKMRKMKRVTCLKNGAKNRTFLGIKYASNGKKSLRLHCTEKDHQKNVNSLSTNTVLPSASATVAKTSSIADRVAELRCVTAAFISEHTLPFSMAEKLITCAKRISNDKIALEKVTMSRTSATYVTTHGVAAAFKSELKKNLNGRFFSLNLDEATNNNMDKIVNVIIQYFDEISGKVVIEHFGSKKENLATAKNIFSNLSDVLDEYKFGWEQISGKHMTIIFNLEYYVTSDGTNMAVFIEHISDRMEHIYKSHEVSESSQARISIIQEDQCKQSKSSCSESRKDNIISELFRHRTKLHFMLNVYRGILETFQSYVKVFQSEKPLMHALYS